MIERTLERLKEAIERDDKQTLVNRFDDMEEAFTTRRRETEIATVLASELSRYRNRRSVDDELIDRYFEIVRQASQHRIQTHRAALEYLTGELSKETAMSTIDKAIDIEDELSESMTAMCDLDHEVEIPPTLSVSGRREIEVPAGTPLSASLTVENLGHQPAQDVTVSLETDLAITLDHPDLSELAGGAERSIIVEGTPAEIGVHDIYVSVAGEAEITTFEMQIAIGGRANYLNNARSQIDDQLAFVRELKDDAPGRGGGLNGIENKFETADKRISKIVDDLDEEDANEIVKRIDAVGNLLETVQKHARALAGTHLTDGHAARLRYDTQAILDSVEGAIDAEK